MKLRYRVRLWWNKLWIREDEFHHSLDVDVEMMHGMTKDEQQIYMKDLLRRREIAHQRDMEKK